MNSYDLYLFITRELRTTETEEKAMAAAAMVGESKSR